MSGRMDRTGQRFGRLTVMRFIGTGQDWVGLWECLCDCGKTITARSNNLTSGTTKSCGCLKMEILLARSTKHGLSGGHGHYTRLYQIWLHMRCRCLSKRSKDWRYYGGRGITICAAWDDYTAFHDWAMANGYHKDLTIDRIDNDGNYEPGNCTWASRAMQSKNRRPSSEWAA
jgi:hypothetical protein